MPLIVAATAFEIDILALEKKGADVLVTGIGAVATAFAFTKRLLTGERPDCVINAGIAGSYDTDLLSIGSVALVETDTFADLGYEEASGDFVSFIGGRMLPADQFPFSGGLLQPAEPLLLFDFLPKVQGLTVNKVSGCERSINSIRVRYPTALVESMEGAAVFYVCMQMGIPCVQLRAISNLVAPRDTTSWNIPLAIQNLKKTLLEVLQPE